MTSRRSIVLGVPLMALLLLGWTQSPANKGAAPRAAVSKTTEAVTDILRNAEMTEEVKRQRVKKIVDDAVDFTIVSKLVLARNYRKFSVEQRETFIAEFKRHLMSTYWKNASTFDFERIDLVSDREETRGDWTVKTLVVSETDSNRLDYRLRLVGAGDGKPGEWKVIDIIIEGVSLVSNFRSQFQSLVSDGGPDHLLKLLRKKNDEAEAKEAERAKPAK